MFCTCLFLQILGADITSHRDTTFEFVRDHSVLKSVVTKEVHEMIVVLRQDTGSVVTSRQELHLTSK